MCLLSHAFDVWTRGGYVINIEYVLDNLFERITLVNARCPRHGKWFWCWRHLLQLSSIRCFCTFISLAGIPSIGHNIRTRRWSACLKNDRSEIGWSCIYCFLCCCTACPVDSKFRTTYEWGFVASTPVWTHIIDGIALKLWRYDLIC